MINKVGLRFAGGWKVTFSLIERILYDSGLIRLSHTRIPNINILTRYEAPSRPAPNNIITGGVRR